MGKIAIVGVEGSGKTVLMTVLGERFQTPDPYGLFLSPETQETSAAFTRTRIVGYGATPCFELERFDIRGTCDFAADGTFCGLYVLSGKGALNGEPIGPGSQFFVPAASTGFTVVAETPLVIFKAKSAILKEDEYEP